MTVRRILFLKSVFRVGCVPRYLEPRSIEPLYSYVFAKTSLNLENYVFLNALYIVVGHYLEYSDNRRRLRQPRGRSSHRSQSQNELDRFLESKNMWRKHIAKDGSCLFRAVAEQVNDYVLFISSFQVSLKTL